MGKVLSVGGFLATVFQLLFYSKPTGLDPQEFADWETDVDGNTWGYRNHEHTYRSTPRGMKIICTDGTELQMGDEVGWQSAYAGTPICTWAAQRNVSWFSVRTPAGSSLWGWRYADTDEEFAVSFRDDESMYNAISRSSEEDAYRFLQTQG